jgi:transcriptional regulator with XRE-family HTH domain
MAGVSQYTVSEIEQGKRDPHPSTLRKLAEALGIEVAALFGEPNADPKDKVTPSAAKDDRWSITQFGAWRRVLKDFNERAIEHLSELPEPPTAEELESEREWIEETAITPFVLDEKMRQTGDREAMDHYMRAIWYERPVPEDLRREVIGLRDELTQALSHVSYKAREWYGRFAERDKLDDLEARVDAWALETSRHTI